MARFRAKYDRTSYYIIQKHHWFFGWMQYDNKLYNAQEAKQRLMDIETYYPNVSPIDDDVLDEIEVKRS